MEQITPALLNTLLDPAPGAHISIYMPTYKMSPDSKQNPIRFRNLLSQARAQLEQSNLVNHAIKTSLAKVAEQIDQPDYWMHQKSGLAVFVSETYRLFLRLPLRFKEIVIVNQHYHLKPLLPLITTNGKFYILTLSQADIKLYQATRDSIDKVYLGDMPKSLQEIIDPDDLKNNLQLYGGNTSRSRGNSNASSTAQGGTSDKNLKSQVDKFMLQVSNHIDQVIINQKAPLVLAGVDFLTTIFRSHSRYPHLTDRIIEGSPDRTTKASIHQSAWKIVRPIFKQAEKEALDEFGSLQQNGKTSKSLQEILPAAHSGRVKNLFALRDHTIWGMFDPDSNTLAITPTNQPGTDDLMNLATIYTLIAGGQVYSLKPKEMIPATPLAAVYRY